MVSGRSDKGAAAGTASALAARCWPAFAAGGEKRGDLHWSLTLDAPLRAETGELYVSLRDQKRKKWEWRLPFAFERR